MVLSDGHDKDLRAFLRLFDFDDKQQLVRYCRDVVITQEALAVAAWASELGRLPFAHAIYNQDRVPTHLRPSRAELRALADHGVGQIADKTPAAKAVSKMALTFRDRRLLFGHMFIDVRNESRWHFLYGDQRDLSGDHWKPDGSQAQPHIHFINWLWHDRNVRALWEDFVAGNAPGGAEHVRFKQRGRLADEEPFLSDGDR